MIIFKLKTKIRRFLTGFLKLNRPTSYPFITSDGFRSLAQHLFDEQSDMKPHMVEKNDIIFVRGDFLKEFFEKKHPKINNPYILISRDADVNLDESYSKYIDNKIIHWFAQHLRFKHEKMTPIPSGVTSYYYVNTSGRGKLSDLQKYIKDNTDDKICDRVSFGFSTSSNLYRVELKNSFKKNSFLEEIEHTDNQADYFKELSKYCFTISPDGKGFDSYKNWEAFYLKVVPIVEKHWAMEYFKSIGLPLIIVNNWDEIKGFNKKFLSEKYNELKGGFKNPAIYMDFWIKMILDKRIK